MNSNKKTVVIIGAGPAGLSAADEALRQGFNVIILEKNSYSGGKASSKRYGDFIVDYGPHVFHPATNSIKKIVKKHSRGEEFEPDIHQALFIEDLPMSYPFKISEALRCLRPLTSLSILSHYIYAKAKAILIKPSQKNFKELGLASFGKKLYELCYGNYTEKVWGCSASEISVEFAYKKLPSLSFLKLLRQSIFGSSKKNTSYLDSGFLYHKLGIGEVFKSYAKDIEKNGAKIIYNSIIERIDISSKNTVNTIYLKDTKIHIDFLVSTIPLDDLIALLAPHSSQFLHYSGKMQYRNLILVHAVLNQSKFSKFHWSYLVNSKYYFNRISEQKNLSNSCAPTEKTLVTLEKVCKETDPEWGRNVSEWRKYVEKDLSYFNIPKNSIKDLYIDKLEKAYPFMYVGYESQKANCLMDLSIFNNLITTGRYGLSIDSDMHDSMQLGREAIPYLINGKVSDFYLQHEQICKIRAD